MLRDVLVVELGNEKYLMASDRVGSISLTAALTVRV